MVADFFEAKLDLRPSVDLRGILWVAEKHRNEAMSMDTIGVAVAFNNFIGKTACMHVVVQDKEVLSRHVIRQTFKYAYEACGLEFLFGLVDSTNLEAIDFDRRIGFKDIHVVLDGGVSGDLVVLGMAKSDCRWI
jgi:hypothetical protein